MKTKLIALRGYCEENLGKKTNCIKNGHCEAINFANNKMNECTGGFEKEARQSERSRLLVEAPKGLEECKVSFERKMELLAQQKFSSNTNFTADAIENIMLEKFRLLLSSVGGELPTKEDMEYAYEFPSIPEYIKGFRDCFRWFSEQAQLALLSQSQKLKAENEKSKTLLNESAKTIHWMMDNMRVENPSLQLQSDSFNIPSNTLREIDEFLQ